MLPEAQSYVAFKSYPNTQGTLWPRRRRTPNASPAEACTLCILSWQLASLVRFRHKEIVAKFRKTSGVFGFRLGTKYTWLAPGNNFWHVVSNGTWTPISWVTVVRVPRHLELDPFADLFSLFAFWNYVAPHIAGALKPCVSRVYLLHLDEPSTAVTKRRFCKVTF